MEGERLGDQHYRYWFVLDHGYRAATAVDVDLGIAWRV